MSMNALPLNITVPSDAGDPTAALDLSVIEELRALAGGDAGIVADITAAFVNDGTDRLRKMRDALTAGDELAARRAAHSLKGMSASIGAVHLTAMSHQLEKAEAGTITHDRIAILEREFQRATAALTAA
jgi:two-component system sensor histidine kinase/response regulator